VNATARSAAELQAMHDQRDGAAGFGTPSLDASMTKTKSGRTVVLTPDVRQLLKNQLERLEAFQKKTGKPSPYLFIHMSGPNRGERIQDLGERG
jgi:hypothetical protein